MITEKKSSIAWDKYCLDFDKRTIVMGILNVTPDSFSDGGKFLDLNNAVEHALKMEEEGADIIDIGGESSRPFAEAVTAEEEILRVIPVIEKLSKYISAPISIDTKKSKVAKAALDSGAAIVNDISALQYDPDMADIVADRKIPVILMHMKGSPKTMQLSPAYKYVVDEIKEFLKKAIINAESKGILKSKIIIDVGIGFGKTNEHNFDLIKNLSEFKSLDVPILIGASRKKFIRNTLDSKPDSLITEIGSQAIVSASVLNGADIVRVHDVANTCATIKIINAIKNVKSGS